jgi:hypothetical protein
VTVHLSCTLHMAQRPVTRERRVLYTGLRLPRPAGADPEAETTALRRARAVREASPTTVSQPAAARTTHSTTGASGRPDGRDRRQEASWDGR